MNENDLTHSGARAVILRHVHDLRNMINCMDLEIHCVVDDPAALSCVPALEKIRNQLAQMEQGLLSLSVRFVESSMDIAAASDLFHHWRQHVEELNRGPRIKWEEPDCSAAVTVDFTAVVAVLTEVCLKAQPSDGPQSLVAAITGERGSVAFSVREPSTEMTHHETHPEAQQWTEWQRLITMSGGIMERTYDPLAAHSVTTIRFPSTE